MQKNAIRKRTPVHTHEGGRAVKPEQVHELALRARKEFKLRHVPLLLCREFAPTRGRGLKPLSPWHGSS